MPRRVLEFQPTPNPNAVKCILDGPIRDPERGPASYRAAPPGEADPLAAALFGVPGVVGLLINGDWITVNKAPEAEWKAVRAGVSRVLAERE
jgi:hypothetical protein